MRIIEISNTLEGKKRLPIDRQKLVRGFLQLMTIMEAAYSQLDMSIGHENGFLSGSVVAYCLGLTDKDPIAENQISPEFSQESKIRNLM